jgi:zinc finger protein
MTSTLFPRIGEIAEQADTLQTTDGPTSTENETDEKVVQEIESLCMKCEEQVSS